MLDKGDLDGAALWRRIVRAVEELLRDRGESVKISSFGTFSVREKAQRIGRNPKTGEEVPIPPRRVLVFRASRVLKDRINRLLSGSGD